MWARYYYFDVSQNVIYGPEYKSLGYYHELRHYLDMVKPWYEKLNNIFDIYLEFISFFSILLLPVFFMSWITYFFSVVIMFFPYAVFRTQEEVRAYIYAFYNYFKLYKLLKKLK